ncbi:hypothetical protein PYCC9005_000373 [Savitreella phatthalungensis]
MSLLLASGFGAAAAIATCWLLYRDELEAAYDEFATRMYLQHGFHMPLSSLPRQLPQGAGRGPGGDGAHRRTPRAPSFNTGFDRGMAQTTATELSEGIYPRRQTHGQRDRPNPDGWPEYDDLLVDFANRPRNSMQDRNYNAAVEMGAIDSEIVLADETLQLERAISESISSFQEENDRAEALWTFETEMALAESLSSSQHTQRVNRDFEHDAAETPASASVDLVDIEFNTPTGLEVGQSQLVLPSLSSPELVEIELSNSAAREANPFADPPETQVGGPQRAPSFSDDDGSWSIAGRSSPEQSPREREDSFVSATASEIAPGEDALNDDDGRASEFTVSDEEEEAYASALDFSRLPRSSRSSDSARL